MIIYGLQACLGVALFWSVYRLFLKNKAAARTNRIFLVTGLLLPFLLPFLASSRRVSQAIDPILLPLVDVSEGLSNISAAQSTTIDAWLIFYTIGLTALLIYQARGVFIFLQLKQTSSKEELNIYKTTRAVMPFSFFGSIVLPQGFSKEQEQLIIEHEQWHIRLRHSWDVALSAVVQSILWFFPLMPLYIKDLKNEHEYEVDEKMLNKTPFSTYAETLLHVSLMPIPHARFHSFSAPTLKTRFKMMTKAQKNNTWKLLIFIPLVGSLMYLNACTKQTEAVPNKLEALASADVETPPQFDNCTATEKSEMMQCFMQGVSKQIIGNFKYPKDAAAAEVQGTIFVQITIDKGGELVYKKIAKSLKDDVNEEYRISMEQSALNIFKDFPKLSPATKDGKPVAVVYTIPIRFALE